LAARGWLDLAALELDGRLLAFALTFKRGGTLFYYLPAFDPDYARYAPSAMLLAHLIETACGEGLGELDFMLGDEPYKAQWASGSRSTSRLVIGAPTVAGRLALAGFRGYLVGRERARRSPLIQRARRYGWRGLLPVQ
jgi:CelD/BcsL family acetyltransferase involved in cellulose biosynthesis